jgi:GNAT superfamily N-acetyltransferase
VEEGGQQAGPGSGPPALRLAQLAVRKHFRGMGLATLLLRRLIQEAREAGYSNLLAPLRGPALTLEPLFAGLGFSQRAVELGFDLASPE